MDAHDDTNKPKVVSLESYREKKQEARTVNLASIEEQFMSYKDVGILEEEGIYVVTFPSEGEGILMTPEMARKLGLALIEAAAEWRFLQCGKDGEDADPEDDVEGTEEPE